MTDSKTCNTACTCNSAANIFKRSYRGYYYTAVRSFEFYLRVVKMILLRVMLFKLSKTALVLEPKSVTLINF